MHNLLSIKIEMNKASWSWPSIGIWYVESSIGVDLLYLQIVVKW